MWILKSLTRTKQHLLNTARKTLRRKTDNNLVKNKNKGNSHQDGTDYYQYELLTLAPRESIKTINMDDIKCYFDISIDGQACGRIVFKLFQEKCPKTCENFRILCTGETSSDRQNGKKLHYKGTPFHRIVRNFMIQGGDITEGNGKGGDSIYGGSFADENLDLTHDEPYLLSMANRGPDTNKSQFFITTNEAPHLDGKHVVFGRVVAGLDTILKIERQEVDSKSRPIKKVLIKDCGQLSAEASQSNTDLDSTIANRGRKRKHSYSSQSASEQSRRNKSRSPYSRSPSISCSSSASSATSASSSSSSISSCSSSHSMHSSSGRVRRRPRRSVSCSSDSGSSSTSDSGSVSSDSSLSNRRRRYRDKGCRNSGSPGNIASKRSREQRSLSSSSSSDSNLSSVGRSRKKRRTNRRLETTRGADDFKASVAASKREYVETGSVPGYKCTVDLNEIPEVPVNRFLQRVPPKPEDPLTNNASEEEEDIGPIEVDLSKFEDIPDEVGETEAAASQVVVPSKLLVIKTNEPVVSKSGRIMRGRGTFKFRTPSPEDTKRGDLRSTHTARYNDNNRSSRWDRNRARAGGASPQYRSSRRDDSNSRSRRY